MELEVMKELIEKYSAEHTSFILRASVADEYYRNNNVGIMHREKKEDEGGNPMRNADNRIPRNFHGLLVNQKASYAFTAPPLFDVGSKNANERVTRALGDEYALNCMELCINAANTSVGWIHYWDDDAGFQWAVVDSRQVQPIWDKSLKKCLMGVLRSYPDIDEETGDSYYIYEYWTDTMCQAFRKKVAITREKESPLEYCYMFENPETGDKTAEYNHNFGMVPFIPFFNNNIHTDDLKNIKPLIDVYDKVFSGFINDLDDIQELIFVLSGYGGTDLNGFLQDLKKYKVIKLDEDAEGHPGASTISIEIPIEARNSVLDATRKAIFEQGQGFDPQPENYGNQSGEALKFMYALLEMKVGMMQPQFELGFSKLVRAICQFYGIACDRIIQTWTRTCIKNDLEMTQICSNSVGIVSKKTILKNHPLVEDADAELEQLKKEQDEQMEQYGSMMIQKPDMADGGEKDGKSKEDDSGSNTKQNGTVSE